MNDMSAEFANMLAETLDRSSCCFAKKQPLLESSVNVGRRVGSINKCPSHLLVQDLMKLHINEKLSDAALGRLCLGVRTGVCEEQQYPGFSNES